MEGQVLIGLRKSSQIIYLRRDLCQLFSYVLLFATPCWTAAHQTSLSITNSQSLLKFISIESVLPRQPSHPLLSPSPPTFNLSQHQGLFQWVSSLHQVAKVLEFQLQHQSYPCSSVCKESACSARDLGSIPGLRRSPGEGNGSPLQCSCLESSMDRGA